MFIKILIKIHELQNFNFLKILKFNNNILYVYVVDSKFYYSIKKLSISNKKYSLIVVNQIIF